MPFCCATATSASPARNENVPGVGSTLIHFMSFSGVSELKFEASTRARAGSRSRWASTAEPMARGPATLRSGGMAGAGAFAVTPPSGPRDETMQPLRNRTTG